MTESLKKALSLLLCAVMLFGFAAAGGSAGLSGVLSVRALAEENNEAAVPVTIVNVTETEIALKTVEGYEYSIDNGVTFVSDPVFTGLQKGQACYVCQRKAAYGDTQAGEISDCVEIKTNTAPVYVPNLNKMKVPEFEKGSVPSPGEDISILAYSSACRSEGDLQWGDLRYFPVKCEVYKGSEKESEEKFFLENASTGMYRAVIRKESSESVYSVKVFYAKERYEGPDLGYVTIDTDTVRTLKLVSPAPPPFSWITDLIKWFKSLLSLINVFNFFPVRKL